MKSSPSIKSGRLLLWGTGLLGISCFSYGILRWIYQDSVGPNEPRDWLGRRIIQPLPDPILQKPVAAPLAAWPLPKAKQDTPHNAVTHWYAEDATGTAVDFFDFDFGKNPKLRWGLFDQDEDDNKPFDNFTLYRPRNVAAFAQQYNTGKIRTRGRGQIIAAWNGAFFGYYDKATLNEAHHLSPIVLNRKVLFNTGNHRWSFGVKYDAKGNPVWKTFFRPNPKLLAKEYDWAAVSFQCLIKDGEPLKMEPFPKLRSQIQHGTRTSTPQEAGHIPTFDHMRTCRASIGWSQDNRHLYLLFVKEPDHESASAQNFAQGQPDSGGWTVPDVQDFWKSKKVWGAVNSDAGNVAQLVYRQPSGGYTFVPSRHITNVMRVICPPNWKGAPMGGGALMYFYVWE